MKKLALALFLFVAAVPSRAEDLAAGIARIESAVLDPSKAITVENATLKAGHATIVLRRGTLIPTTITRDGAAELVFIGDGNIELDPPDAIEASQLELFTGNSDLDEDITSAVIVTGNDAMAALLRKGTPVTVTPDVATQAAARFAAWKDGPYRAGLEVPSNLLADQLREPGAESFFAALFANAVVGEFLYTVDGNADEEITLGQFIPEDLTEREKRRARRELTREQRKGRGIGARVEDFGDWNTWLSARIDPKAVPAVDSFQPQHYAMDVTIEPNTLLLRSTTRVTMLAASGGSRVITFTLHPDLQVQSVKDASGATLFHHRFRSDVMVVLPSAPAAGSRFDLEIAYSGVAVEKGGRKVFAVRDPERWYPQIGANDRATYEATFHWPKKLQLLAAGHKTGGGVGADGSPWAKYELETVTGEYAFEIGRFEIEEFKAGHVHVTLGFDATGAKLDDEIRSEIRSTIETALPWMEERLGTYPGDHLTVVTVPRSYSQSLFTFMTLSTAMMEDYGMFAALLRASDRRSIIAHELSHQWWGHVVGWQNYRAQWISEAMAQYVAMRYTNEKLKFDDRMKVTVTQGWQRSLNDTTPDGRTLESVGPLVLGERLSSSRAPSAYQAIVYDKGGLVLLMLSRVVGEKAFDAAVRKVVERAAFQRISTDEFVDMLAEATNLDIAPFARLWIYGTGLPSISYAYEFAQPQPGKWKLTGTARQNLDAHFVYRVVADASGALHVQRQRVSTVAVSQIPIFVPVRLEVLNPAEVKGKKLQPDEGTGYIYSQVVVRGKDTPFEYNLSYEPKRMKLDPRGEVLAQFFDERRNPRRVHYERAKDLAADGKWSEAEQAYRAALAAPPTEDIETEIGVDFQGTLRRELTKVERELLAASIHLGLARTLVEQQRDADAAAALVEARKGVSRSRRVYLEAETDILEARLDLRRGDAEGAFKRLRKLLRDRDSVASAEAYLLLAIAAKQSNHPKEMEKAREHARKVGVDVALLR